MCFPVHLNRVPTSRSGFNLVLWFQSRALVPISRHSTPKAKTSDGLGGSSSQTITKFGDHSNQNLGLKKVQAFNLVKGGLQLTTRKRSVKVKRKKGKLQNLKKDRKQAVRTREYHFNRVHVLPVFIFKKASIFSRNAN